MVFQDVNTGQAYMAMRGTEGWVHWTQADLGNQSRIMLSDAAGNMLRAISGDFTRTDPASNSWTNSAGDMTLTDMGNGWTITMADGTTITLGGQVTNDEELIMSEVA
ncbi:hypothetical protein FEF65_13015 [Mariprofundus erugo]|uniref:Uncharacterized protein n=1 Tax=Mariprofundus erugo TaxID=2528639 RepID=A0A5R9GJY2_9PROT|nr:hypothetical protein [Mariprofundus erugo]TLS65379.1 hypothetical protein FEF65_13015 [Mariprofundus erugo]